MSMLKLTLRVKVWQWVASLDDNNEVYPQGRLEWPERWNCWVAVSKLIFFDSQV